MPEGIRELQSAFLATLRVELAETHLLGDTPAGWRRIDTFRAGTLIGPRINARLLSGGSDSLLRRQDGAMQPDVRLTVETDDNAIIQISYRGIRHGPPEVMERIARGEQVPSEQYYLRNAPFFETAAARYDWLNRIVAVGLGRREPDCAAYDIYEIL
jgi:hypothetical protein